MGKEGQKSLLKTRQPDSLGGPQQYGGEIFFERHFSVTFHTLQETCRSGAFLRQFLDLPFDGPSYGRRGLGSEGSRALGSMQVNGNGFLARVEPRASCALNATVGAVWAVVRCVRGSLLPIEALTGTIFTPDSVRSADQV